MIIHRYSEWHEPEKPPFTVEDLIKAISEMMMRASVSFDEALRHLMRQGLPMRGILQINGLDELIDKLIADLKQIKQADQERFDLERLLKKLRETRGKQRDELQKTMRELKAPDAVPLLDEILREKNLYQLYKLKWALSRRLGEKQGQKLEERLEKLLKAVEPLLSLEELGQRNRFTGPEPLDIPKATHLKEKFDAIDQLIEDLKKALESGDLSAVSEKALRQQLGEAVAAQFEQKKDEIWQQFDQALTGSGLVDRDEDGLFKLTPGAARKLGEHFLVSVFSELISDGVGKHSATKAGEGSIETVSTRPMEYGDPLTHIDMSGTFMNALVREGPGLPIHVRHDDFMVHETRGSARSAIVMMLDMSGSMARFGRFYNARKIALALDALIRSQYSDDRLHFVGFYTFARRYKVGDIMNLAPKPVTYVGGSVNLRVDMSRPDPLRGRQVPEYFTNIQKGLELSRVLLANEDTRNKSIILITDGAPTASYEGSNLCLTYPPTEKTFANTLQEVQRCTSDGILISTFMMASDFDFGYSGEENFLTRLLRINRGRIFYPQPDRLTQYVMVDFLQEKRKLLQV